ncbi:uncharacterized protein LOC128883792 isoform X2 [Hylaeus volcanicus]|uniref:uncharacterized protein LOC128883792 isoform X2 n=1 Tax=Hylaeus volcanicus TaxID=313075 RepID=UPI0023B87C21|nr:uncharacterized protein LOC128883792 isoform X2 [Hylaeus volcanicus]
MALPSCNQSDLDNDNKLKCNICLEDPEDPVVTRCGHLYCWICLHTWLQRGSVECPVCKSGVTVSTVIPVYGTSNSSSSSNDAQRQGKKRHAFFQQQSENSKEPGNTSETSQPIPERPRAERHDLPPSQSPWGMHSVQFGFFPFGIGVFFTSADMMSYNANKDPNLYPCFSYL